MSGAYMQTYMYTHTHTHTHTHMWTAGVYILQLLSPRPNHARTLRRCVCVCVCEYTDIFTCTRETESMCARESVCVCVCVHACVTRPGGISLALALCRALRTLHPTPYTLHPTPCTLHPAPCTLFILPPFPHPTVNPLRPTRHVLKTSFYALHTTSKGNLGIVCLHTTSEGNLGIVCLHTTSEGNGNTYYIQRQFRHSVP